MQFLKEEYKKAFTLAEVMLGLIIVGILSVIMIRTMNTKNFDEKASILMAYKAIESMTNVFTQIRQTETEVVPAGTFMLKNAEGGYEFAVLSTAGGGALAETEELAGLFGDYMKKNGDILNFCTVTKSCNDSNIKGFKLPGDLYIGIEKFETIQDCPTFYMPDNKNEQISAPKNFDGTTKQCWGKLHIDTNGPKIPNTQNEDYFIYGLDEYGIVVSGS